MIDEIIPNGRLHRAVSLRVVGSRTRPKEGHPPPKPFGLAGRVASLYARSQLKLSQAIFPHINGALTQFTSKRWSLITAQRLAQLTHRHISKRFLSNYPIGPNSLSGISRPIMDEFKDRMMPPTWGELRSSQLGPWGCRSCSIRRGVAFEGGASSRGKMKE
jgi:hypothetical protein